MMQFLPEVREFFVALRYTTHWLVRGGKCKDPKWRYICWLMWSSRVSRRCIHKTHTCLWLCQLTVIVISRHEYTLCILYRLQATALNCTCSWCAVSSARDKNHKRKNGYPNASFHLFGLGFVRRPRSLLFCAEVTGYKVYLRLTLKHYKDEND